MDLPTRLHLGVAEQRGAHKLKVCRLWQQRGDARNLPGGQARQADRLIACVLSAFLDL